MWLEYRRPELAAAQPAGLLAKMGVLAPLRAPNADYPSDHLPVGARFEFSGYTAAAARPPLIDDPAASSAALLAAAPLSDAQRANWRRTAALEPPPALRPAKGQKRVADEAFIVRGLPRLARGGASSIARAGTPRDGGGKARVERSCVRLCPLALIACLLCCAGTRAGVPRRQA